MNNLSLDELLNKAFVLACFILGDRRAAVRVVEEAMGRLDVTMAAQGKRLYYKPNASAWTGQDKSDRYRNKVLFSELHLLQRLVYITSEPFEQRQEQAGLTGEAGQAQMLIHFIKHLVRITTRRNSFYVTLGLSRLLYNYTTAETMEVYNAVIQDPERVKDDYYYRSRKGVLMQELKKRFGGLVEVARGPRGEERFQASTEQSRLTELAKECLSYFTPWYTPCLVPAGGNPIIDGIAGLASRGQREEDKVEVDRIHAVLHPDCHGRLIKSLGFEEPERRLEVPHFFLSKDSGSDESKGGSPKRPAGLEQNELDKIKGHLDDQSARRKRAFAGGMLRILVDGEERARLDLARSSRAQFAFADDAELMEVRAMVNGDDLLLASHLFTHREPNMEDESKQASIVLEGGQKLALTFSHAPDETEAIVNVAYQETQPFRALSLSFRRLARRLSRDGAEEGSNTWSGARLPALAFALLLILLAAFGIVQFVRNRRASQSQPAVATGNQPAEQAGKNDRTTPSAEINVPHAPENPPATTGDRVQKEQPVTQQPAGERHSQSPQVAVKDNSEASSETPRNVETTRDVASTKKRSTPERRDADDATRSLPGAMLAVPLSKVRKIYFEISGDDALKQDARDRVIESLSASGRFTPAQSRDEADALLKVTVRSATGADGAARITASAALINALGETIWRSASADEKYTGSTESVAAAIVRDLLDAAAK